MVPWNLSYIRSGVRWAEEGVGVRSAAPLGGFALFFTLLLRGRGFLGGNRFSSQSPTLGRYFAAILLPSGLWGSMYLDFVGGIKELAWRLNITRPQPSANCWSEVF